MAGALFFGAGVGEDVAVVSWVVGFGEFVGGSVGGGEGSSIAGHGFFIVGAVSGVGVVGVGGFVDGDVGEGRSVFGGVMWIDEG